MCLAIPGLVKFVEGESAEVELGGISRKVSIMMVPDVRPGDYVLVHTGFAIEKIDRDDAEKTLALFKEMLTDEIC